MSSQADHVRANLERIGALAAAKAIVRSHWTTEHETFGGGRTKNAAAARRHIWAVIRHSSSLSYTEIAKLWDVDHTTVLAAVQKHEAELAREFSMPERAAAE